MSAVGPGCLRADPCACPPTGDCVDGRQEQPEGLRNLAPRLVAAAAEKRKADPVLRIFRERADGWMRLQAGSWWRSAAVLVGMSIFQGRSLRWVGSVTARATNGRASRSRHAKRLAAFVAFFVVGLTVSVAFAAPGVIGVITGTTGTDTTAAEPSTTSIGSTVADDPSAAVGVAAETTAAFDTTTALLTGTTATNEATTTDGTAPAAPDNAAAGTPGYSSLIVKLASGLSSSAASRRHRTERRHRDARDRAASSARRRGRGRRRRRDAAELPRRRAGRRAPSSTRRAT